MSELSISVLTPCRIDTLCVGCLLALLVRREGGMQRWVERAGPAAVGLGAAIVLLSAFCATARWGLPVLHQIRSSLYGLFFGALTLTSLEAPANLVARAFQGPLLRFFGKYSYGLYVYHGIFTWCLLEAGADARLDALLGNHALAIAARAVLGVGVSLGVAVLSYQLLEKRFLALKKYFEAPGGQTAAPAPAVSSALGLSPSRAPPR
jgi:peptidoglycan/LPS O-acetylase OafA/YrhL